MKTDRKLRQWLRICGTAFLAAWTGAGCEDVSMTVVPVASVTVVPTETRLIVGEQQRLRAIPTADDGAELSGRSVEWLVEDSAVVRVDANGRVEGVGPGATIVEARSEGTVGEARVQVERPAEEDDPEAEEREEDGDDDEDADDADDGDDGEEEGDDDPDEEDTGDEEDDGEEDDKGKGDGKKDDKGKKNDDGGTGDGA